jgi:GcrA cell cycle regulator
MSELQKKHAVVSIAAPMPHTDRSQRAKVQVQPAGEQSPLILPNGKFVTTLTLSSRTCRWPVGDPTELGFHYCGHSPNSHRPYCDAHDLKGYQPVRSRAKPPPQPH